MYGWFSFPTHNNEKYNNVNNSCKKYGIISVNMEKCVFCDELSNNGCEADSKVLRELELESRVITEESDWVVIPTLGCFCEGYVLLVNKMHKLSLYHFTSGDIMRFSDYLEKVERVVKNTFSSKCVVFEHGIVSEDYRNACCVDHVHLHIIPCTKNQDFWPQIAEKYRPNHWVLDSLVEMKALIEENNILSYMLFKDVSERWLLIDATSDIYSSQFFRQIVYLQKSGKNARGWDWRENPFYMNMKQTYYSLKKAFEEVHE